MSKFYIRAGWQDAPHLDQASIDEMLAACEPHLREARSQGIPSMGSGMVFPVPERDLVVKEAVGIKPWWRRCAGFDVGYRWNACVWGAHDVDTDIVYIYDVYLKGQADPEAHASAIRRRDPKGMKIPIAIDPASKGRSQIDGRNLMQIYRKEGLHLVPADNAVESGIQNIYARMASQRLKILENPNTEALLRELRTYRRDEQGRIVNKSDYHCTDALRYLVQTGLNIAKPLPQDTEFAHIVGSKNYGI